MLAAQGQLEKALAVLAQAITARPNEPVLHNEAGKILMKLGRADQAIVAFRAAARLSSGFAEAFYNLGAAHQEMKEIPQAIAAYRQAIKIRPAYAEAFNNLGNALLGMKDYSGAVDALQRAVALVPTFAPIHYNLGCAMYESGQIDAAVDQFRTTISIDPHLPEAWYSLGNALKDRGEHDRATAAFERAMGLRPGYAEAWNSLAALRHDRANYDGALAAARRAIELKPNFAEAYANLGSTLKDLRDLDGAIAAYERAIALQPTNARMEWNLALALLLNEDYQRGWRAFESRLKNSNVTKSIGQFNQPRWDGGPLRGRTILVCFEQGFGDAIQFVRFIPEITQRGGRVIAMGLPALRRLLEGQCGISQYIGVDETLPAFDCYVMLLSLAGLFHVLPTEASAVSPYLKPDAHLVHLWRSRLGPSQQALRVGLVWAGNPNHSNDRNRSVPLHMIARHLAVPGVRYYSLQKDANALNIEAQAPQLKMVDLTAQLEDFADTAAFIANLDFVIACDTSVAHLAGALGKPVWILLPYAPDWRWMLGHSDSVWYPTARLFRQPAPGDWSTPLAEIASELTDLVRRHTTAPLKGET